jgi:hypothetical protein
MYFNIRIFNSHNLKVTTSLGIQSFESKKGFVLIFCLFDFWGRVFLYISEAILKLAIFLPQPPEYWDYWCALPLPQLRVKF